MKHFINKLTGGDMWVADSREKEYIEAGHKPVSLPEKTVKPAIEKIEPEEPKERPKPMKRKITKKK